MEELGSEMQLWEQGRRCLGRKVSSFECKGAQRSEVSGCSVCSWLFLSWKHAIMRYSGPTPCCGAYRLHRSSDPRRRMRLGRFATGRGNGKGRGRTFNHRKKMKSRHYVAAVATGRYGARSVFKECQKVPIAAVWWLKGTVGKITLKSIYTSINLWKMYLTYNYK